MQLSKIQVREFSLMEWVDPRQVLVNLRWIETNMLTGMDERIRRLRTNLLNEWREARLAALFAFGIGDQVLNTRTLVSKTETRDFDFVVRWQSLDADYFYPGQLKELPPDDINPQVSLDDIYNKLEKYCGVDDLSVVIHLNRGQVLCLLEIRERDAGTFTTDAVRSA